MTTGWLYFLIVGALAGWLAGKLTRGHGFGLLADIGIGVIGAVLGGFVFGVFGLSSYNLLGSLVTATVGAMLFLVLLRYLRRA